MERSSAWFNRAAALLVCGMHASAVLAATPDLVPPPLPERAESGQFTDVPAPWRDYMIAARSAQRLDDPLQRCLAFPDLPGTQWPAGHAQAHCRYHHEPTPSLDDIDGLLRDGQLEQLERLVATYQERHHPDAGASEIIHRFFARFEDDSEHAGRVADAWLDAAPDSAFAHVAKAHVLRRAGWQERGNRLASQTPRDGFRRMRVLMDQAVPHYRKALASDPGLMDAYIGLMDIAKADSRNALEQWASQEVRTVDPGCAEAALTRMSALSPRWGGSLEAMLAYANSLEQHVSERPLLANQVAAPYAEASLWYMRDERNERHAVEATEVALRLSSNDDALQRGAQLAVYRADGSSVDTWRGAALYLQEARFRAPTAYSRRVVGRRLMRLEPEWAVSVLLPAVTADPQNAEGHYLLAVALHNSRLFDPAQAHYLHAVSDEQYRQAALRELSVMWLYDAGLPDPQAASKAAPYITRLLEAYPRDGRGHLHRFRQHTIENGFIEQAHIDAFLEVADAEDPPQREAIENILGTRATGPGAGP